MRRVSEIMAIANRDGKSVASFWAVSDDYLAVKEMARKKFDADGVKYDYIYTFKSWLDGEGKYTRHPFLYPELQYGSENIAQKQIGGV